MNVARPTSSGLALVAPLVLGLLVAACESIGPGRVPADRFDYNESIAQSSKTQMLLNLVRMRYRDTPVFLAVSSVLTQYIYSSNANIVGSVGTSLGESQNSLTGTAGLRYVERPTITYSPLSGDDFANQLLRPISTDLIFSLVESGWPADWLLMMSLQRLNDLRNLPFDSAPSPEVRDQLRTFQRAIGLMIGLAKRSAIETRAADDETSEDPGARYLIIEDSEDPETQALVDDLKQLLGLDPDRGRFRITDRITQRKPDEITIRIRSLITLMGFLSRGIEVPEAHAQEGRASPTVSLTEADDPALHSLMKVHSSTEQPVEAFVAVRYQGYWFYIPHTDQQSKQAFTLLNYLFQMQALPEAPSAAPVITVPAG
jgi:hypothetical protein